VVKLVLEKFNFFLKFSFDMFWHDSLLPGANRKGMPKNRHSTPIYGCKRNSAPDDRPAQDYKPQKGSGNASQKANARIQGINPGSGANAADRGTDAQSEAKLFIL
jgi:hypothetical protein